MHPSGTQQKPRSRASRLVWFALAAIGLGAIALWVPNPLRNLPGLTPKVVQPEARAEIADVRALFASRDGKTLVAWTPNGLDGLDPSSLAKTCTFPTGTNKILSVSMAADGTRLAVSTADGTLTVFDVSTQRPVAKIDLGRSQTASRPTSGVALSPDGRYVSAIKDPPLWCEWEASTGRNVWQHPLPEIERGGSVEYSPDGRWIVASGYGIGSSVIDDSFLRNPNRTVETIKGMGGPAEFSRGSLYVAFWSPDGQGLLRQLKADTFSRLQSERRLFQVLVEDDGTTILSTEGEDWNLGRVEIRSGSRTSVFSQESRSGPWLPVWQLESHLLVAAGNGDIYLLDPSNGQRLARFEGHKAPIRSCVLLGRRLVTSDVDGQLFAWNVPNL